MQIIIAKHAGFCSGVDFAYKKAVELAKSKEPVYILGLLVHNSSVIQKLENLGIKSVSNISEIPPISSGTLIISAHGVGPKIYEEAKKTGLNIIDTTCAWVKKAQRIAKDLYEKGYQVLIVGDKNHTEVKGIVGWANDSAIVVENERDAKNLSNFEKIGILAQTTQSLENFNKVIKAVKNKTKVIKICNTICDATAKRQESAVETARKVDVMLVIGDVKSANTKRLKMLCEETGTPTYQIHSLSELDISAIKGKGEIGIIAGASTPDWIINEIVSNIENMV